MFNQSPAHTAELGSNMFPDSAWQARALYLQMTCRLQMRKTMRRASSCRFFLVLFGSFRFFLVDLHVMHLQAQPATSSRHVGFDKDVDKSRWHSPEAHGAFVSCFDICHTCDRHVEDAQEASPSQKRHSASRKGSAVSLPLPFEDRFFCDTDVRRCGMCRLP